MPRKPFPPGDTSWENRRSHWREVEYMFREVCAAILPSGGLQKSLAVWAQIAQELAECKRKRKRCGLK